MSFGRTNCINWSVLDMYALSSMEPTTAFIFRYTLVTAMAPVFGEYIFPQLQTSTALVLSPDCTKGSI